jgi:hypothetical protein
MTEAARVFTCPECFGSPLSYRRVRVKRRDGDYLEKWPNLCSLCQGDGTVTLDQLVERVPDEQLCEYITRVQQIESQSVSTCLSSGADPDGQGSDIPF